jgi:hypothetical protein
MRLIKVLQNMRGNDLNVGRIECEQRKRRRWLLLALQRRRLVLVRPLWIGRNCANTVAIAMLTAIVRMTTTRVVFHVTTAYITRICASASASASASAGGGSGSSNSAAECRVNVCLRAPHAFEARGEAASIAQTPLVFGGGHH